MSKVGIEKVEICRYENLIEMRKSEGNKIEV